MNEVPVWTIIIGIIAGLWNVVLLLVGVIIKRGLDDIKETLRQLAVDDREALAKIFAVEQDLTMHKLYVSEHYARKNDVDSTIKSIFDTFRQTKEEIIERVREIVGELRNQIKANGGGQ